MKKQHANKAAAQVKDLPFNLTNLSTYEQARELAARINALSPPIDGGVKPELPDDNVNSGIFHPLWGGSDYPEPNYTDDLGNKYYPLEFRFACGAGNNVGMLIYSAKRHAMNQDDPPNMPPRPLNWAAALGELRSAVEEYIKANPQA